MAEVNRTLEFDDHELSRIREVCRALGISYVEFIHDATISAVQQVEATTESARRAGVFG